MRAARFVASRHFELAELPRPEPGPGQVRVRVEACGICGSDLHYLHAGFMRPGHTPGHEIAGRVDALGAGVRSVSVGDAVAVEPLASCGTCAACREGRDSICRRMRIHGIHVPGGFADELVVAAERVYRLADGLAPEVAALCEPVAVAVHGLDRGGFEPGQRVLVLGAGAVGLVTLITLRALGAKEVILTARHAHQAERARALGASRVLGESEADAGSLDRLGRELDIDLAVETVGGSADTLACAAAALRPGGKISVLGLFLTSPEIAPLAMLVKEIDLHFSNCYHRRPGQPADFARAAAIVDREREALATLVTHRFGLGELDAAFERAGDKRSGAVKVVVRPG